ncbi:Serine/threonine-protein kinase tel1, partial [Marasmius crinis-equi]
MPRGNEDANKRQRQKAAQTIRNICDSIGSEKIKERQEGIESLKTVFSDPNILRNFGVTEKGSSDTKAWLSLFQSLFKCVLQEKAGATKKTTQSMAAAERRLTEAARTVRWMIEKTRHMMGKKVTTPIHDHLCQTMIHKGALLGPVVLDYVKALESLLTFRPHLEHLKSTQWVELVELSFNVILGDNLKTTFSEDDDLNTTESAAPSPAPTDNMGDMYDDDSAMDVDVDGDGGTPRPKKRRRAETPQPTAPTQPSTSYRPPRSSNNRIAVTPEQVAFTSLLATLMSSPYAPFNSQDDPYITSSVLSRLLRFLQLYPTDTTLHHDFLRILTHTIDHISYNNTALMTTFARKSWDSLVKLWAPKNKNLKEGLISVYRILFPFLTSGHGSAVNQYSEMLWNLWNVLSVEGDSKWGLDVLSIESLRLELSQRPTDRREAFVAKVFRAGDNFDRHQAMMWAILELQADCAEKLYRHSESVHSLSTPSRPTQSYGKRARIENPLSTVLASIRTQTSPNARIYHLQILLFFIDSHWGVLHREMKLEVFSTLLQFISVDDKDGAVQNWIMLCFAAIASADFAASENSSYLSPVQASASFSSFLPSQALREAPASWEHVWTHAIRRTNSSALCRTACHTALAILSHPNLQSARKSFIRPPLSPQRVVADLEALLKDLDVQGPSSPYDTVCAFLSLSLRIVNQDVRIFRLQLEEKVLSWLTGFWQLNHIDALEVRLYLVKDVLLLLETICSCSKRSALLCRISLPPCLTVDTMETVERSRIIREFVLEARLPEFQPAGDRDESTRHTEAPDAEHTFPNATPSEADVIEPRAREKRISVFFSKTLESLASQWRIEMTGKPKAELAKQLLDIAVISLSFEAILYLNGIRWDKRSINAACKLIGSITPLLNEGKWTLDEKYLVLQALEPLFLTGMAVEDDPPWTAMLTARPSTGVRYELLRSLMPEHSHNTTSHYTMQHLRLLWTNFEVQGCFSTVPDMLREVLAKIISHGVEDDGKSFDADDKDGFAPIKTADKPVKSDVVGGNDGKPTTIRFVETCISFLTVVPLLQSSSGEPTRDQDLMELIINAPASVFVQTCPVLLSNVRRATLYLSGNNLDNLLDKWTEIAGDYTYSRSPQFSLLALGLADASLPLWTSSAAANSDYAETIRNILTNSVSNYESKKIGWKVRDSLARLLEKYLAIDPRQEFWMAGEDCDQENLPSSVIQKMNGDEDVRVRFRVAVISARLFEFAGTIGVDPMNLYGQVRGHYSTDIESYEHIVTRILSLGNIMIVSSAVRRGPYWHLLELCFYSDMYTSHMEATLKEVAGRIGLKPFSALFEAYASQIAFSIRQAQQNVLRIPPHLLGYKDAKERAVATFRLFTPANLHGGGNARTIEHGQHLFRGHCETIQKKPEEGLWECFGDIFAHELLSGIKSRATTDHQLSPVLLQGLTSVLKRSESDIKHALREKLDSVVSSILRAIGDQDFSPNGPIRAALASAGVGAGVSDVFAKLTAYRTTADFDIHEPNLPKYDTWVVLVALTQVLHAVQVDPDALTYHVLQELFSSVESSQIVNEQLRLTNAITIWIALQHERFHSHTLLHAVVRGECSLLAQVDLARSAQSVLEWCFARYRQNAHQDARFPDVLVRVACVCCDHSKDSYNTKVLAMGADLLSWIDRQAIFISEEKGLGAQIQVALTTWPHPVPAQLDGLSSSVSIGDLSKILDEDHIPSNKFRIVQRLCQETSSGNAKSSQFAQYDFWNLKECIPSNDRLGIEDVLSFASLLLMNQ